MVSDKYLDSPGFFLFDTRWLQLRFRHNFDLQSGFDGGVLEVRNSNGVFRDVTDPQVGGSFALGGYNSTIAAGTGNPIAGRQAWSGNSGGYMLTIVDLPSDISKVRWRMASDNNGSREGWRIDDATLTQCHVRETVTQTATATPTFVPTHSPTNTPTNTPTITLTPTASPSCSPVGTPSALYSQLNEPAPTPGGVYSQDYEYGNSNPYDSFTADDFIVPEGEVWYVNQVVVVGEYTNGGVPAPSFNVWFLRDVGTLPEARVLEGRYNCQYVDAAGSFTITLSNPVTLYTGTYWLSAVAAWPEYTSTQWLWENRATALNSPAAWENPDNGFNTGCYAWNRTITCLPSTNGPDQLFEIIGTIGGICVTPTATSTYTATPSPRPSVPTPPDTPTHTPTFTPTDTPTATPTSPLRSRADFDGDGRTDLSVYRPSEGNWYYRGSTQGFTAVHFGVATDIPVPADFDNDEKTDISVFRPSNGFWYRINSSDGTVEFVEFGLDGDIPQAGDYEGDGRADQAVFRPTNGTWYWRRSSDGQWAGQQFGQNGDRPVAADYDGDGRTDLAVYRGGIWYRINSSTGAFYGEQFGIDTDITVVIDYDDDGRDDIAVFRPSDGNWYFHNSGDNQFTGMHWGQEGDIPVPGDYERDGRPDLGVFRDGTWFIYGTSTNIDPYPFGLPGDLPIPNMYVR
jgi:hypothetical protein